MMTLFNFVILIRGIVKIPFFSKLYTFQSRIKLGIHITSLSYTILFKKNVG